MEIVSVKSLRRAALALMLGVSCHVQSAQVISLEMSLSATDINALVNPGLTHQCLYFEQPHTFEQILFIQTAEPALVGHA